MDHIVLTQMKLDKHIKHADPQSNASAYHFCMVIYQSCRNIPISVYIKNKTNENKFLKWYDEHKTNPTEEVQQEPNRWSQVNDAVDSEEESARTPVNRLEDPLGLKPSIHTEVVVTSNFLGKTKTKTRTRNSILMKLDQLDITSPDFKPTVFLSQVHQSTSPADLQIGLRTLREKCKQVDMELKALIAKNANVFADCNHFYEVIGDMIERQVTEKDAMHAQRLLGQIEITEQNLLSPMLKKKTEIERLRSLIGLTQRFSYLFKLPTLMQTYLSHVRLHAERHQKHHRRVRAAHQAAEGPRTHPRHQERPRAGQHRAEERPNPYIGDRAKDEVADVRNTDEVYRQFAGLGVSERAGGVLSDVYPLVAEQQDNAEL